MACVSLENMGHWQKTEERVSFVDSVCHVDRGGEFDKPSVGEHRSLGLTGGAAGVDDRGDILAVNGFGAGVPVFASQAGVSVEKSVFAVFAEEAGTG